MEHEGMFSQARYASQIRYPMGALYLSTWTADLKFDEFLRVFSTVPAQNSYNSCPVPK